MMEGEQPLGLELLSFNSGVGSRACVITFPC